MVQVLMTDVVANVSGPDIDDIARQVDTTIEPIVFAGNDLTADQTSRIEVAFASLDLFTARNPPWRFFDVLDSLENLRWVHLGFAGIDHPRFGGLLDRGVRLSNSPAASAEPIAHTAMAGLLSLARDLPFYAARQREHAWQRLPTDAFAADLSTQTMVVFGLGAIGGELARLARAFGMYVIGVRRSPRADADEADEVVHPDSLERVLRRADWLAVTANLTPATRRAIDGRRLDLLPPGARVINVSRGPIIQQAALVERLKSGAIAGAYLDVFEEEPLPGTSELWDMPNVIITPHASWAARGNEERARLTFLANLAGWLTDRKLPTEVRER